MKFCLKCLTEYIDDCEYCSDCGGSLLPMSKAEGRMHRKMKHPVKLITLEDRKEKELLKALLSEQNITFYAVEKEDSTSREETTTEDIYVEENKLQHALLTVDSFQGDLKNIREFLEVKARMITPTRFITLEVGEGADACDLVCFLEERSILSCFETERYYEASVKTAAIGSISGRMVIKEHVYVDAMYREEAIKAATEFLEGKKLQKEQEKMGGKIDERDGAEEVEEEYEGEQEVAYGGEYEESEGEPDITEYTDCEYLPDRFFKWVRGIFDRMK